ncbi:MAG: hypothetical protein H7832_05740 [Magnetococcus sp. DMHC-6]
MNMLRSSLLAMALTFGMMGLSGSVDAGAAVWSPVVEKIVKALNEGDALYRAGEADKGAKTIQEVYFSVMEAEKLEDALKKNMGPEHAEEVEDSFGDIRKAMKENAKPEEISAMVKTLSDTLLEDGKKLDAAGVAK